MLELIKAPLIGLLFAIFMPFIGIYMIGKAGLFWIWNHSNLQKIASFGWQPSMSYILGRKSKIKNERNLFNK